jgi:spore germination protein (amino acid permease)
MQEKLNPLQIAVLVYMTQSGVTLFSLPRLAAETFGTNGWAGLVGICALVNINILLIALVYKYGKGRSVFGILEAVMPFWLLVPFYLMIAVLFIGLAVMVTKKYILLLKMLFYQETPVSIFLGMAFILCFILLTGGIYHIGKATTVLFFVTIWTVLLLSFHVSEFSFLRMTPFFFKETKDVLEGAMNIYTAFLGFELSLFLFPYVQKKWTKSLFIGNGITSFVYISVTFICFGFFSFKQLSNDMYPVITLLEYIRFPFVERVENLIFTLFALKVLITIVMYLWAGQQLLEQSFQKLNPRFLVVSMLSIGYSISFIPDVIREVDEWLKWLTYVISAAALCLPLALFLVMGIEKLMKRRDAA